ncbi:estrogen sulfotransferase-like [Hyposmocoma kahamanoa]|uniref:estrogen sulfotransferase-like n=1 Tax=Hyposmocoma kahamanoa TaxID=1477025 RepID=UPI000E6D7FA2|nr:estrogen sulfotransferase-like [Hyposmocoma kahamanoa]
MSARKLKNFPYEIKDVDRETSEELMKNFTGEYTGFLQVGPKGYFFPKRYEEEAANIYNFQLRPDDTFVITYPRSGTTWTQELVWLVANDLDYAKAKENVLIERFPYLEFSTIVSHESIKRHVKEYKHDKQMVEESKEMCKPHYADFTKLPSPRFFKSHMPISLLPPSLLDTCKVVFVARDPRDVAVSFYHLCRLFKLIGYSGDLKTFWNYFIKGLVHFTPYFEVIKEAWANRNHPNMLFLFYEELSKDLPATIRRVCQFLGKQYSEDQIAKLCEHLHIDNFKINASVNEDVFKAVKFADEKEEPFIRRGKVGGWRDYFDEEMTAQAERWIADNLRDTDLRYPTM